MNAMRILLIRHGEPDYATDSLTEKGKREALLLSERLAKIPASAYYVSPLGRAKETAEYTLRLVGRQAETLP
uniref:Putative phosphoglycerate mutase n=1 Tax=uncultured bacterium Ad_095_K16_contig2 TaxID=1489294 RepID=A0A0B4N015_9BACT|nr:putative phosphoglycerate mutase [uncultured bacterium Ad_095_K16_contig2]